MAGRSSKYPWNEWFEALDGGGIVGVVQGVDFEHDLMHMRQQILLEARRRDVPVRTTILRRAGRIDVQRKRRRTGYPWDRWLNGDTHRLLPTATEMQGKTLATMAQLIRQSGRRRGLLVRTSIKDGSLWFQALPRETNTPAG